MITPAGLAVVVPIKSWATAKARLAGALTPAEREQLAGGARRAPAQLVDMAQCVLEGGAARIGQRALHVQADSGQRRAQLVRGVGRHLAGCGAVIAGHVG